MVVATSSAIRGRHPQCHDSLGLTLPGRSIICQFTFPRFDITRPSQVCNIHFVPASDTISATDELEQAYHLRFLGINLMMAEAKTHVSSQPTPITCHVLNTVTGQPAKGLHVSLALAHPHSSIGSFEATTNENGRVASWNLVEAGRPSLAREFDTARDRTRDGGPRELVWSLKVNAGRYFEGTGWWDVIEIRFKTVLEGPESRAHWHVPLLLSPYSYTTYRGS